MGVGGQRHLGRFTPGKETRYPLYRRLGGSGRVRRISPPPGFEPRTVQQVASRYTDWAIPAHLNIGRNNYTVFRGFPEAYHANSGTVP